MDSITKETWERLLRVGTRASPEDRAVLEQGGFYQERSLLIARMERSNGDVVEENLIMMDLERLIQRFFSHYS